MSGKSSATLSVEEIMTPESVLKTVMPEDTVLAAMELMIDNNFRHVPVVRPVLSTTSRNSCPEPGLMTFNPDNGADPSPPSLPPLEFHEHRPMYTTSCAVLPIRCRHDSSSHCWTLIVLLQSLC